MPRSQTRRAQAERANTCDALLAVEPTATTLCEGWTAHDLAAHLWIRENELVNSVGSMIPPLAGRTAARMAELKQQLTYPELVGLIRQGPPRRSLFAVSAVDEAANGAEYLIHGMDVRRPSGLPEPERDEAFYDWAWSQLKRMVPLMLRRSPVALVFEREGRPDSVIRAGSGNRIVTVIGRPDELLLYASGRRTASDVRLIGVESAVAAALGR